MGKIEEKIEELLEVLSPAESVSKPIKWNGYNVYKPIYKSNMIIGYPYVILEKNGEVRLSTEDESLEFLDFEDDNKKMKNKYN